MATTGAPNWKYAASDSPDLVDGAYAKHVHELSDDAIKSVNYGESASGLDDDDGLLYSWYMNFGVPYAFKKVIAIYNYIVEKAFVQQTPSNMTKVPFLVRDAGGDDLYSADPDDFLGALIRANAQGTPSIASIIAFTSASTGDVGKQCSVANLIDVIKDNLTPYTENLSNVTPVGVQTSALDSPKGIVSHDLHVVLTHYPPMAGDSGETEIVVPRLVGHIEVDGTLGGGGGAVSPNARYLQITFENFPTDATNDGSSNVAVVTSGSNPTYLGTCFVPMTLGSTLDNAVIVSLPTVGDSGTLESPTIYFS